MTSRLKLISMSVIALAVSISAQPAHAGISLSAVGSYNITSMSSDPAVPLISSGSGFGFGGLVGFKMMPLISLETGALMTPFKLDLPEDTFIRQNYIVIPALLRLNLPIVSVGAGIAYGIRSGGITARAGGEDITAPDDISYKNNLGVMGSVAFRLPVAPMLGLLLDVRYTLGLTNHSEDADTSLKFNNLMVLGGVNFSL